MEKWEEIIAEIKQNPQLNRSIHNTLEICTLGEFYLYLMGFFLCNRNTAKLVYINLPNEE